MKITRKAKRQAKRLFRLCMSNDTLDAQRVRQVVSGLTAGGRRDAAAVLSHFRRLVRLYADRHSARIESAVPLEADMQSDVQADLAQRYGSGINSVFVHNPALIGGMRVQVGSDVYDGSVRAGLAALERSF